MLFHTKTFWKNPEKENKLIKEWSLVKETKKPAIGKKVKSKIETT